MKEIISKCDAKLVLYSHAINANDEPWALGQLVQARALDKDETTALDESSSLLSLDNVRYKCTVYRLCCCFLDNTWATAQSTSNLITLLDYLIQLKTCGCLCVLYYLGKAERNK